MNHKFRLKGVLVEIFGSQCAAAHALGLSEWRLSRIVRGWIEPNELERTALVRVLGEKVANRVLQEHRPNHLDEERVGK